MSDDGLLVDVTYRGLKVAQRARAVEVDGSCLFVHHETPLPVGAPVTLARPGEPAVEARVVAVVEQEASAKAQPGMRIRWSAPEREPHETLVGMGVPPGEADDEAPTSGRRRKKSKRNGR
jgi:hypothetical protein